MHSLIFPRTFLAGTQWKQLHLMPSMSMTVTVFYWEISKILCKQPKKNYIFIGVHSVQHCLQKIVYDFEKKSCT